MKKLVCLLLALLLCTFAAFAADALDLSTYTDAELAALQQQVAEEIRARAMANAPENPAADFRYVSNGAEVRINAWIGESREAYIPDEIDGLPVTQLGPEAFSSAGITSLRLPDTLVSMDYWAFMSTSKLQQVLVMPTTLKSIGSGAFTLSNITGLVLQSDCFLSSQAFNNTSRLQFCYIRPGCDVELDMLAFQASGLEAAVIPADVTVMHAMAFHGCKNLTVYCPAGSYTEQYCKENFIVCNTADYDAMVAYYEALYPAQ